MTILNKIYANSIGRLILTIAGIVILFFIASLLIRGCADTPAVVTHHEQKLRESIYKDSIQTVYYLKERKFKDSLVSTLGERITKVETIYRDVVKRDTKVEYVYRDNPTLENCNEVVKSKNNRISILEGQDSTHKLLTNQLKSTIVLLDTTLNQKNKVIDGLRANYSNAIGDLSRATRKRPVAITVGPNYSVGSDFKIRPGVGVQIGFKIAQF